MRKVGALKALQDASEEIDVEYRKERIILENKYRALKLPHLISRDKIISGEVDVPKTATDDNPGKLSINISAENCPNCIFAWGQFLAFPARVINIDLKSLVRHSVNMIPQSLTFSYYVFRGSGRGRRGGDC